MNKENLILEIIGLIAFIVGYGIIAYSYGIKLAIAVFLILLSRGISTELRRLYKEKDK